MNECGYELHTNQRKYTEGSMAASVCIHLFWEVTCPNSSIVFRSTSFYVQEVNYIKNGVLKKNIDVIAVVLATLFLLIDRDDAIYSTQALLGMG